MHAGTGSPFRHYGINGVGWTMWNDRWSAEEFLEIAISADEQCVRAWTYRPGARGAGTFAYVNRPLTEPRFPVLSGRTGDSRSSPGT
ncbi:MAG: hypothetical protein R2705_07790 [Ilumatobacteraceae bacterium]